MSRDGRAPGGGDPTSSTERPSTARELLLLGLVALVAAVAVVHGWFDRNLLIPDRATWEHGRLISAVYDPPTDKAELFLNQGDGQLFAAHAQDPFLQHPERIRGGEAEQAYRLQRPLYGWVGWAGSLGRPGAVAWTMVGLTVVAATALAVAAGWAAHRLGGSTAWGLGAVATTGVLANLLRCGPETLGTALLAVGLGLWLGPDRRRWPAVAAFGAAGLARETMLLVPATLLLVELWAARHRRHRWRDLVPLVWSFVPYVAWVLVLRVGLGAWPRGRVGNRLSLVPFGGLVDALDRWQFEEVVMLALVVVPAVAALVLGRDQRLRAIVAVWVLFAASMGEPVWIRGYSFTRVLLPLVLASVLALAHREGLRRRPVADRRRGERVVAATAT